jgi:hypothetical protein
MQCTAAAAHTRYKMHRVFSPLFEWCLSRRFERAQTQISSHSRLSRERASRFYITPLKIGGAACCGVGAEIASALTHHTAAVLSLDQHNVEIGFL